MHEKVWRRYPEKRTAGGGSSASRAYPPRLHKGVDSAFAESDAAYLLDLGAGDRLVVGDHREGLDRGARQFSGYRMLDTQLGGEIRCGAKRPSTSEAHKVNAAPGIVFRELVQQSPDIGGVIKILCQDG